MAFHFHKHFHFQWGQKTYTGNLLCHTQCCTSLTSTKPQKGPQCNDLLSARSAGIQPPCCKKLQKSFLRHNSSVLTKNTCWNRSTCHSLLWGTSAFPWDVSQCLWMLLGLRHFWRYFRETMAFYVCLFFFFGLSFKRVYSLCKEAFTIAGTAYYNFKHLQLMQCKLLDTQFQSK